MVEARQIDHGWTQETLLEEGKKALGLKGSRELEEEVAERMILQDLVDKIYEPCVRKKSPGGRSSISLNGVRIEETGNVSRTS